MRIIITGNMGYVGPVVVRHLRDRFPDAELIGLDLGLFAHCLTTRGSLPEAALTAQYFGDVRDVPADFLRGTDAVIHLAAISNDPMGNEFETVTHEINQEASLRLAHLAADAGVGRFVFASSCSVYGAAEGGPRRETDPLAPLTAYARSKIGTEQGLRALENGRMTITCLRFATACGMSDRLRLDLVLNDFVACAVSSGEIRILSDGTPWRPLIDVADMARAIEWAIGRDGARGGQVLEVNAGSNGWNYQVKDLAEAVAAEIPGATVRINPQAAPDKRSYRVDFSRFAALAPGHQPRTGLAESVRRLRDGLQAIGFDDPEFRGSRQIRLKVLKGLLETGELTPDLRRRSSRPVMPHGSASAAS
ncbi:MAG: SDR family oxidoreductase [Rhodospirillales bacterium]|jgi:nucleoside-diphosphate-sugar epimerase|nr:SDR family oxidoreductase [Rhodospirillales bacterium]